MDLLCGRFPYHNRFEWEERIRDGRVIVDGNQVYPDFVMQRGMRLEYRVEGYEEPEVPVSFHEIASTENLALVHKPAGLPVHKTGKVFVHTLANLYREQCRDDAWTPLNRLDVETSGIVAFARGRDFLRRFSPIESQWKKIYLAVVHGEMSSGGSIELPLAEKAGDIIRSRMHPDPDGKPAKTLFQPLRIHGDKTLVLVRTLTGRKHQIRCHLAALGFPIVGDKMYSLEGEYYLKRLEGELDEADIEALGSPHHLLHAFHLEIRDQDGEGIAATDFDLPDPFFNGFPELRESLVSLPASNIFQQLANA